MVSRKPPPPPLHCRIPVAFLLMIIFGLLTKNLTSIDPWTTTKLLAMISRNKSSETSEKEYQFIPANTTEKAKKKCATVEEMGEAFARGYAEESLRVRRIIHNHFATNGASRIRKLAPEEFCRHGFVMANAKEAGLGNEFYKILTAAALAVMLNRSLIIAQTRDGQYPFGNYVSYSNATFTLKQVKHLWRRNRCLARYNRRLTMRIDDFLDPPQTGVLCSNWREWDQPIILFQNTGDAMAAQFFLKNVHPEMREAASELFGSSEKLEYRPNVFGELMRALISPSKDVERAVNWALGGGRDPDVVLHMRMMMNTSVAATQAAVDCLNKALRSLPATSKKPKLVLLSDTPSMVNDIATAFQESAEVLHFDYEAYEGNMTSNSKELSLMNLKSKDWGPAPRWAAFVDFFLASRARHAIVSGARQRVGTTYAQLIAALAAANVLDDNKSSHLNSSIVTFLTSFQSTLLTEGLKAQSGWGHIWSRFTGPLSCRGQPNQCAVTPLLPPGWWDGVWQSPIPEDVRKMEAYGIELSGAGASDDDHLMRFCESRTNTSVVDRVIT